MIQWAIDLYLKHTFWMATLGYALPFIVNLFIFLVRTKNDYAKDIASRKTGEISSSGYDYYHPTLTIGVIFARFLGILLPIVNAIVMVRNVHRIFAIISNIFEWIGEFLSIPLVPKREKGKAHF